MKNKIGIFLMVLGINFLLTTILCLLNEYSVVSYAFGICAMGVTTVLMDWRMYK